MQRLWGTGKIEARPDQSLRRPVAAALHMAVRELAPRHRAPDRIEGFLGVLKAFAHARRRRRGEAAPARLVARHRRARRPAAAPTPGTSRSTWSSCSATPPAVATDVGAGIALFIDEMQDVRPRGRLRALRGLPRAVPARRAADRGRRRAAAPARPCSARKSLLRAALPLCQRSTGSTGAPPTRRSSRRPSGRRSSSPRRPSTLLYEAAGGYPYFVQAYGKVAWDLALRRPITADDVRVAAPEAEEELAVGFFGCRYERATPAEREYMRAMARPDRRRARTPPPTVADGALGRKPSSLSPARDALIKKGLIYCGSGGLVAFTVPHFGRYLRAQPV